MNLDVKKYVVVTIIVVVLLICSYVILEIISFLNPKPKDIFDGIYLGDTGFIKQKINEGVDLKKMKGGHTVLTAAFNWQWYGRRGESSTPEELNKFHKKTFEMVKILIENGAEINDLSNTPFLSRTPLIYAIYHDMNDVAKYLLENGADANLKDNERGRTPIFYTCDKEQVDLLLEYGADINAQDNFGETVLLDSVKNNRDEDYISFLLEKDADPKIKNNEGISTLEYVKKENIPQYLFLLKDHF